MFARWPELVGEEVAQHATPESFADGTLVVRTDSTAWATQLKLLAPAVVRRLNEDLGHGTVSLIEVLGPHLPSWKKGPRSVRDGRGPARHLREPPPDRLAADLRGSRTYRDSTAPLSGHCRAVSWAAQRDFVAPGPPAPGDGGVGYGP